MDQIDGGNFDSEPEPKPVGVWISVIANGIAACGGAIFFFTVPGARFRGMEPEARLFLGFAGLGTVLGLCFGLPLSIRDLFWRRFWFWGSVGAMLALTPLFAAGAISDLAAWHLNLIWD